MLAHLWPCEDMPVFLQKSVGGLFVGRDSCFVSPPCCRRSTQHQFSPLSLLLGSYQRQNFAGSTSSAAFGKLTGNDCEMVPRSGCVCL